MDDKLTIVGPEPTELDNKKRSRNVNIEAFLLMAKYNNNFQKLLYKDRDKALIELGIEFTAGEKMLIKNINNTQLKEYIESFEVKGITKKSLRNWVNAASIVLLLSTQLINCVDSSTNHGIKTITETGIMPDSISIVDTGEVDLNNY